MIVAPADARRADRPRLVPMNTLQLIPKLPEGLVQTRFAKLCQVKGAQNARRAPQPHPQQFPKP
jgi:hypothetical protein